MCSLIHRTESPRLNFQWKYVDGYCNTHPRPSNYDDPPILNIGCSDDPLGFGILAHHVDLDDWSEKHRWFTRADAADLPFPDQSYYLVILGDILEHVADPMQVITEACRVARNQMVATIFEEWRLPGHGQWIEEARKIADAENVKMGFKDREDYQNKTFPLRKGYNDDLIPHLIHINQFDDSDIIAMTNLIITLGFKPIEVIRMSEAVHEGHTIYNWLAAYERIPS